MQFLNHHMKGNSIHRAGPSFIVPIAFCLMLTLSSVRHTRAQSPQGEQTTSGPLPTFEVASVKLDNDPDVEPSGESRAPTGDLYSVTKQQVAILISEAYGLSGNGYDFGQLMRQLPKWAQTDRFDIEARASSNPTKEQVHLMLRSLLADRFKFAMHYETRQGRFYNLVLVKPGKLGPNIRPFGNEPPCPTSPLSSPTIAGGFPSVCGVGRRLEPTRPGLVRTGFRNVSMQTFTQYAAIAEGPDWTDKDRPIFNHTGLSGTFDLIIEYDNNASSNPSAVPVGPAFIDALRDQLGLKLEPATGPIKTFVIDHIEEPTPN